MTSKYTKNGTHVTGDLTADTQGGNRHAATGSDDYPHHTVIRTIHTEQEEESVHVVYGRTPPCLADAPSPSGEYRE